MAASRYPQCMLAFALVSVGTALAQGTSPPPQGCISAESRQFDFWVGKWDVYAASKPDQKVAASLIENLYSGCAIRENWMPLKGTGGGSLSSYVASERRWRQTWVDSSGTRADFSGGWNGKALVLEGLWPQPGHPHQHTRMTYTPHADGSVEQAGESSDDGGKTWTPSFDLVYRRAGT